MGVSEPAVYVLVSDYTALRYISETVSKVLPYAMIKNHQNILGFEFTNNMHTLYQTTLGQTPTFYPKIPWNLKLENVNFVKYHALEM